MNKGVGPKFSGGILLHTQLQTQSFSFGFCNLLNKYFGTAVYYAALIFSSTEQKLAFVIYSPGETKKGSEQI